jgi:hypothetical protein
LGPEKKRWASAKKVLRCQESSRGKRSCHVLSPQTRTTTPTTTALIWGMLLPSCCKGALTMFTPLFITGAWLRKFRCGGYGGLDCYQPSASTEFRGIPWYLWNSKLYQYPHTLVTMVPLQNDAPPECYLAACAGAVLHSTGDCLSGTLIHRYNSALESSMG